MYVMMNGITVFSPFQGVDSVKDHDVYMGGKFEDKDKYRPSDKYSIGNKLAHYTLLKRVLDEVAIFKVALAKANINTIMTRSMKGCNTGRIAG